MQPSPDITDKTAYTVRRLSRDTLYDLACLHTAVYGPVSADHYYKKYDTAFTGKEFTGFIAYNATKEPIGYYGVIPCFIQYGNEVVLAAQSADTMTHPGYRYRGMFVELSAMAFELCRQLGIRLIFGFPNENSYHGAVHKLQWKPVNRMSYFTITVQTLPLADLAAKNQRLEKYHQRYAAWLFKKHLLPEAGIHNSVIGDGFAGVCRTPDYDSYKQQCSSSFLIRTGKIKVRLALRQSLLIGDMEGVTEQNIDFLLRFLKKLAARAGIRSIQFHCSPDIALFTLFEKRYTPQPSYHVLYQDFGSAVPPSQLRFTFADIDIF